MCTKKIFPDLPAFIVVAILLLNFPLFSQNNTWNVMDVNNITSWINNDGFHPAVVKDSSPSGFVWNGAFPKGTAGGVYTEGIVWGGKVFDGITSL